MIKIPVYGLCFRSLFIKDAPNEQNLNTTAYKDILDNSVLPIYWQQFEEGSFPVST